MTAKTTSREPSSTDGDDADAQDTPPPLRFVSSERGTPRHPPARRLPICFPNITLQMMRLKADQLQQLKETGWLREVAFKTTPDVTKLEIAAFLESVYGMSVERVHTINYLGQKRVVIARGGKKLLYRDDDWKKAYVVFRPPPGMEHLLEAGTGQDGAEREDGEEVEEEREEEAGKPLIERIRAAARAPRPAPKPVRWQRERRSGDDPKMGG